MHGCTGVQAIQQRSLTLEAGDVYIEPRTVQPICDLDELPFGAANVEMIEEPQNSNPP